MPILNYKCPSCIKKGDNGEDISFLQFCNGPGSGKGIHFSCNTCPSNNGRPSRFTAENEQYQGDIFKLPEIFKEILSSGLRKKYPITIQTCCALK